MVPGIRVVQKRCRKCKTPLLLVKGSVAYRQRLCNPCAIRRKESRWWPWT